LARMTRICKNQSNLEGNSLKIMAEENKAAENKTPNKTPDSTPDSAESTAPAAEKAKKPAAAKAAAADAKAEKPAAKKEKPPQPEDKPFNEFIEQYYLPGLKTAMAQQGIDDLSLEFAKRKIAVMGQNDATDYWQVQGKWVEAAEGQRQFNVAFLEESINGPKVFTLASNEATPSTLEQFMGDERKTTLDLLVLYTVQRLNGQKWLTRN
jgi:hypothetical protein